MRAWAAPCKSDSFGATLPSLSFWTATEDAENSEWTENRISWKHISSGSQKCVFLSRWRFTLSPFISTNFPAGHWLRAKCSQSQLVCCNSVGMAQSGQSIPFPHHHHLCKRLIFSTLGVLSASTIFTWCHSFNLPPAELSSFFNVDWEAFVFVFLVFVFFVLYF